ncbi:hypothetical protein Pint_05528 [Pistacia integerrima]|uniref:Uncharacterized protein n=1 Tax=Pistacia integerrima TaxID=434235 RepID=A0ACC0Z6U2_9ROSI|nr:hypothetical protein Pint_05528 [Pistacia integerrima]
MQFIQHLVLWVTRNLRFTYRKLGGHLKEMKTKQGQHEIIWD